MALRDLLLDTPPPLWLVLALVLLLVLEMLGTLFRQRMHVKRRTHAHACFFFLCTLLQQPQKKRALIFLFPWQPHYVCTGFTLFFLFITKQRQANMFLFFLLF